MTARFAPMLAPVALCIAVGCAAGGGASSSKTDFGHAINQIQRGTPRGVVERELGQPDRRERGVVGTQPTGPRPPIKVAAGSQYEHWVYDRGESEYHVFLGPGARHPGEWEVLSVSANPKSTKAMER